MFSYEDAPNGSTFFCWITKESSKRGSFGRWQRDWRASRWSGYSPIQSRCLQKYILRGCTQILHPENSSGWEIFCILAQARIQTGAVLIGAAQLSISMIFSLVSFLNHYKFPFLIIGGSGGSHSGLENPVGFFRFHKLNPQESSFCKKMFGNKVSIFYGLSYVRSRWGGKKKI